MSSPLRELAHVVSQHLEASAERASAFVRAAGLACRQGCAECCLGAHVECTPLELLPVAFDLVDEGAGEAMLATLAERKARAGNEGCVFLERRGEAPDGRLLGRCGRYARRPAVCIHFGASVRNGGKGGKGGKGVRSVVACRVMKDDAPARVEAADAWVAGRPPGAPNVPDISEDALAFVGISPSLGQRRLPFDDALREALEKALHAVAYETDVDA